MKAFMKAWIPITCLHFASYEIALQKCIQKFSLYTEPKVQLITFLYFTIVGKKMTEINKSQAQFQKLI